MSFLFIDVETSGLIDYRSPLDASHQPRLVGLGLVLCDASGAVRAKASLLVQPDGWTISPEAARVNGLTDDICQAYGFPLDVAWALLVTLAESHPLLVAHNVDFDRSILDIEWLRHRHFQPLEGIWFCTKEALTPVLKLPKKNGHPPRAGESEYKWPSLDEAHEFFFGTRVDGHHDALADAEACMRVYFALQHHQETTMPEETPKTATEPKGLLDELLGKVQETIPVEGLADGVFGALGEVLKQADTTVGDLNRALDGQTVPDPFKGEFGDGRP